MITAIIKTISLALQLSVPNAMDAICWVESSHRNVVNKNDGGSPSYGVCQIKLDTANWMKELHRIPGYTLKPADLMVKEINIFYATLYFKYQLHRYGQLSCAISAYNAGHCIKGNQKTYVRKVMSRMSPQAFVESVTP